MDAYQRIQLALEDVGRLQQRAARVAMNADWLLKQIEKNEPGLQEETYRLCRRLRESLDAG